MEAVPGASLRRVCRVLGIPRSSVRPGTEKEPREPRIDELLARRVKKVIEEFPAFGYRRVWAILKYREGLTVNRKAVYRIMKLKGWFLNLRKQTPRPRVKHQRSVAAASDQRWATDITHIACGEDGWAHLVAVIDCHDREIVGFEMALRGRAREAERALEDACLGRFGTLRPPDAPWLRVDNGLVFQSKKFREACGDYGISLEFITPYTPQQNGLIERFFRSLKEECVWLQQFRSFEQARSAVRDWITWYNEGRPHQSLGYLSPVQYRNQQLAMVA